jgi:hypothetical protein
MGERTIAAVYAVEDDPTWPNPVWVDMPEANPRARVRVAAGATAVTVTVFSDGTFEADGPIESDVEYAPGLGKPAPATGEDEDE